MERNGTLQEQVKRGRGESSFPLEYGINCPVFAEPCDPFASHLPTPGLAQPVPYTELAPYEVDVKTERQMFVNDVPLRHDSTVSTFSALGPPQLHTTLPTFPGDEWFQDEYFKQHPLYNNIDPLLHEQTVQESYSCLQTTVPVDDYDRPLLNHFVDNVLRLLFPILEAHQRGPARARAILDSLETNKSYFHCCLSVSAIHLKSSAGLTGEQIDHDIMRHRFEAVSQLCLALNQDTDHEKILDATLAMIFFHCFVGLPDDHLPDIPWDDHFQAVTNLVNKLELPTLVTQCGSSYTPAPFSMSLTAWIDILGATMLGKMPQFAHTYRSQHLNGTSLGLQELMGCEDRVMYLISEIACLDALKTEGRIDDITLCSHVSALGTQLKYTEPADTGLESPLTPTGAIRPEQLTKNMTAVFRIAARIYLCSLVPGFDCNQPSNVTLVSALTDLLQYIPTGPYGFDRSLVWPLLITGIFSVPTSSFRDVLAQRAATLGDFADFGSFGRMYRLLQEVWRVTDEPESEPEIAQFISPQLTDLENASPSPRLKEEGPHSPIPDTVISGFVSMPPIPIKKKPVHWRDVMSRNQWRYLLI